MELKYLVILSVFGVAAGIAIPTPSEKSQHGETSSDLESSFSSGSSDANTVSRDKRHLLFKKLKKHQDTVYVNRRYDSGVEYRPNREVHHHHHYSYPAPPPQTYQPAPSQEYHHYHGASAGYQQGYSSQGSGYYTGGHSAATNYYPQPNYGDGGYAHYGGVGGYSGPPPPSQQDAGPVANAHNGVNRGQGAAAVNNIAIIHARAGSSSNNLLESESRILPRPLPVDIEDALNMAQE